MAEKVKQCIKRNEEEKAIQMIGEMEDALRWRDPELFNFTLIHHAASEKSRHFLSEILKNEKVLCIL